MDQGESWSTAHVGWQVDLTGHPTYFRGGPEDVRSVHGEESR